MYESEHLRDSNIKGVQNVDVNTHRDRIEEQGNEEDE